MTTPYGSRPGIEAREQAAATPRIEVGECVHCHAPIFDDDATDETGTLHFAPCAGEAAAMVEDMIVDRARERDLWSEWGGR